MGSELGALGFSNRVQSLRLEDGLVVLHNLAEDLGLYGWGQQQMQRNMHIFIYRYVYIYIYTYICTYGDVTGSSDEDVSEFGF